MSALVLRITNVALYGHVWLFCVCSVNHSSTELQRLCLTPGSPPFLSFVKFKALFLQHRGPVWGACLDLSLPFVCFLFVSLWGNLAPEPWLPLIPFRASQPVSPQLPALLRALLAFPQQHVKGAATTDWCQPQEGTQPKQWNAKLLQLLELEKTCTGPETMVSLIWLITKHIH